MLSLAYVAGTALGLFWPLWPLLFLVLSCVAAVMVFGVSKRLHTAAILTLCACFLAAWGRAGLGVDSPSDREVSRLVSHDKGYTELTGRLIDNPSRYGSRMQWMIQVDHIRTGGKWVSARGVVQGLAHGPKMQAASIDERWYVPGLLDASELSMRIDIGRAKRLEPQRAFHIRVWSRRAQAYCAHRLGLGVEDDFPQTTGLVRALMLGLRDELPRHLKEDFASSGTLHVFAISGLHIAIAAGLCTALLGFFGVSRRVRILVAGPLLVFFVLMTGARASAVRACVMAIMYGSAGLFWRRPDARTAFAVAAVLILAVDPTQLLAPGFQLSFSVVFGLLVLTPRLIDLFTRVLAPESVRLKRPGGFARMVWRVKNYGINVLAVSVSAWLVSAPLTAYYFNLFTPIALVGNLIVVPAAFLIMLNGVLALLPGALHPVVAEVFNHGNRVLLDALLWVMTKLTACPWGHSNIQNPSLVLILAWYVFLAAWAFRWRARSFVVATVLMAIGAGLSWSFHSDTQLDVLDVGPGLCVHIEQRNGDHILVDAGPRVYSGRVVNHLKSRGVDTISTLILTHGDAHHVGGALELLNNFEIDEIWRPPVSRRSQVMNRVLDVAKDRGISIVERVSGQYGTFSSGLSWEIWHPEAGPPAANAGEGSLVLRLAEGPHAIVIMGGAGASTETAILEREAFDLSAPVLVAGDQLPAGSLGDAWMHAVHPKEVIISCSGRDPEGKPHREDVLRIEGEDVQVWRTDRQGTYSKTWSEHMP